MGSYLVILYADFTSIGIGCTRYDAGRGPTPWFPWTLFQPQPNFDPRSPSLTVESAGNLSRPVLELPEGDF